MMADIDPRAIALRERQNLEEQALSKQWRAQNPHLYDPVEMQEWRDASDVEREVITYADRKTESEFFAPHRARWLREGRELQAQIDAEKSGQLELVEIRPSTSQDRFTWDPFSHSLGFEPSWWHKVWHGIDSSWCLSMVAGGEEVARVELEATFETEFTRGPRRAGCEAIEVHFFEVVDHRRNSGIGTATIRAIEDRYSDTSLMAFSEEADGFWSSLGWDAYPHDEGPSAYRTLYVRQGRMRT